MKGLKGLDVVHRLRVPVPFEELDFNRILSELGKGEAMVFNGLDHLLHGQMKRGLSADFSST